MGTTGRTHTDDQEVEMAKLTTQEELFVHELQDMYYAEKTLTKVLPKLANESTDRELSKAFTHHLTETERQIENLEKVFENLGKPARASAAPASRGSRRSTRASCRRTSPRRRCSTCS